MKDLRYLTQTINRAKESLIKKAKKYGLTENFGQDKVYQLKEEFIDISSYSPKMNEARNKIQAFSDWCSTYNP